MCTVFYLFVFFYMIPSHLYSRFLVFVQALHLYLNVVISYSFHFIFKQIFYVTALSKVS